MTLTPIFIGLGSNIYPSNFEAREGEELYPPLLNLLQAINHLQEFCVIHKKSSIIRTKAQYISDQPDFANQVIYGETSLSPQELLSHLKAIEEKMGRQTTYRNGPRLIDLDILYYGDLVLEQKEPFELIIPHPRIQERLFVLEPLLEIAPDHICPKTGLSLKSLRERLK